MKLKHHALAIASMAALGFAGSAQAAKVGADFEIYGNFYPQAQSTSYSGGKLTATSVMPKSTIGALTDRKQVNPVNSYIGFKAARQFGDVRAGFDFQGVTSSDKDAKNTGFMTEPRDAYVFVEHKKLGRVTMGQFDSLFKKYGDPVRMLGVSSGNFNSTATITANSTWKTTANFNTRTGQHVAYETANLNGFKAGFSQANPANAGAETSKKINSATLNWSNETYSVALGQETHKGFLAAGNDKDTANRLSLGYKVGKARFGADFTNLGYDNPSATVRNYKTTTWQVTGEYALDANWVLGANYAKGDKGSCTLVSGAACATDGLGADMVSLGARYNYDKDIGIFMLYGKKNTNENASLGTTTLFGGSLTDMAVGVQFKF
jgi:hypothetical protein